LILPALTNTNPIPTIKLTTVATSFNAPIGVDYYIPSNCLIVSVNYAPVGGGYPYNFELVSSNGVHSQFSEINGLNEEVYIASVRDGTGGFVLGEMFTGNGQSGEVMRIRPDGTTIGNLGVQGNAWAVLTNQDGTIDSGLLRGEPYVDRTGV